MLVSSVTWYYISFDRMETESNMWVRMTNENKNLREWYLKMIFWEYSK